MVRIAQRWAADPVSPQSLYEDFFWDTFEVRDGKLYEHWDAGLIADPNARPNPQSATPRRRLNGPAPPPQTQSGPQPPAGNPLERVIGACDIVTIIHKVFRQDPTMPPGNFYDSYVWDTFRVRNGRLVEHWDSVTLPVQVAGPVGSSN